MALLPSILRSRLAGRVELQKIIGNVSWLLVDRLVRLILGLYVSVRLVNFLGPADFGIFFYAVSFAALFMPFATLGLDSIVVRELVREPEAKDEILATTFLLRMLGGAAGAGCAIAFAALACPGDTQTLLLVAILAAGFLFQGFDAIDFWYQSRVQSRYSVLPRNGAFVALSAAKIALIVGHAPLVWFAAATLAEIGVGAVAVWTVFMAGGARLRLRAATVRRAGSLLRSSWPLLLSGLAVAVYMRIDAIMLRQLASVQATGVFGAATRLSEAWYFVPLALSTTLLPVIVKLKASDASLYMARVQQLFNLMAGVGYAVAIPFTFLSGTIVSTLYDPKFAGAGPVLAVHIWIGVFVCLGLAREPVLIAENLIRFSCVTTVTGAVLNVLLNLVLIPYYGPLGAAVATLIAQFVAVCGSLVFYRKTRSLFKMQCAALMLRWSTRA